jgi:DNA topoisomerase-2
VAFNSENKLTKYSSILDMLREYVETRRKLYFDRKTYIIDELNKDISLLKTRVRFIEDFIEERITIIKKRKAEIEEQLVNRKYPKIEDSFDYLLKMPIYSLSLDKIDELNAKIASLESELSIIESKTDTQLWHEDIDVIEEGLKKVVGSGIKEKVKFQIKKKTKAK